MNQSDLEYIVNQVTQQVLSALNQGAQCGLAGQEGLPKILVLGKEGAQLPKELCRDAVLLDVEDYRANQNILRYDQVVIARLNITQLADIAQGRIGDEVSCAVLHALLNGVETLMLEDALSFRKFAGKGSTALYHLLESYAQTLQVFGVKPAERKRAGIQELPPVKPAKFKAPAVTVPKGSAQPNAGCLVTQAEALDLVKQGGAVHLPAGAIVTPAARDIFSQAGIELIQAR